MLHRYHETAVNTASPETLIVQLYEGAIRFAHQARGHMEAEHAADRARAISRAVAIVNELQRVLDLEQGGEIARNLYGLYDFVGDRLVSANVDGRIESIDEAIGVLSTLVDAWREIAGHAPRHEAGS